MKWKNIVPISVILIPYMVILPIVLGLLNIPLFPEMFSFYYVPIIFFAVYPIVLILNVCCAFFFPWDTEELVKWNMRIKLYLIPFYLFVVFFAMAVLILAVFLMACNVLLMLVTSCYGIRALFRAKYENSVSNTAFWLLLVGHLFFVTDVISSVILYVKEK